MSKLTCRFCLGIDDVFFSLYADSNALLNKVCTLMPIQIENNDKLPFKICKTCHRKVNDLYKFYEQITNVEKELKTLLDNSEDTENYFKAKVKNEQNVEIDICELKVLNEDEIKNEYSDDGCVEDGGFKTENVKVETERSDQPETKSIDLKVFPDVSGRWKCVTCFEICQTKYSLTSHYNKHVKRGGKLYLVDLKKIKKKQICNKCNIEFSTESEQTKAYLEYFCSFCNETFNDVEQIIKHGDVHLTLFECSSSSYCKFKTYNEAEFIKHEELHQPPYKFVCKVCNEGFNVKLWYKNHFRKHPVYHKCRLCEKTFRYVSEFSKHRKSCIKEPRIHIPKNYFCDICGKQFSSNQLLTMHRNIHLGVRPYTCDYCGKSFAKKTVLVEHIRVHTGEKPYKCQVCDKRFSQRTPLNIHIRLHSGERPFECNKCLKRFIARGQLNMHQKKCFYVENAPNMTIDNVEASQNQNYSLFGDSLPNT